MKIRQGFVSNSSSSSFIITNISNKPLDLVAFVKENPQLIKEFLDRYYWYKKDKNYTQENLIKSAKTCNKKFLPHIGNYCTFGDDDGSLIGSIFDYILRDGGQSKNFSWQLLNFNR